MPEETDDPPQPPEQPSLLGNLAPDEMFARGMQPVEMTAGAQGTWQPPSVEEANCLFPNYTVLGLLGRGGMGAVYKARQTALDRLVAIKLLPLEISVNQEFADRFVREARAMARLNHPNIISVFDFGATTDGHLYFVMEYVEGANLADIIHQTERGAAFGLDGPQALSIVEQVCTALAYAHGKGIVHRDIKPANVMIDTESQVKVADFGLARVTDPSAEQMGHTMTGTVMGTPDYMAPEQMKGMNVDHRADIYSLGVMVYEMLCRKVPKGIFDPPSQRTGCDTRIDQIVIKAMHQSPDRRYQSTQEMKADVVEARRPNAAPFAPSAIPIPPARLAPAPPKLGAPQPPKFGNQKPLPPLTPRQGGDPERTGPGLAETEVNTLPPAPPQTAVMKPVPPPTLAKSKTPLYAGIAAVILAIVAFSVFKLKPQSDRTASAQPPATGTTNAPEQWQDLIPGIKLPDDVRDNTTYALDKPGHWELSGGSLRMTSGRGSVVVTPAVVGPDYDVELRITRSTGAYHASVGLPVGSQKVIWATLNRKSCGFERIGNTDVLTGPASVPDPFGDGKPHHVLLSVRTLADGQVSLRSIIDGQPSAEWTGPASELSVHPSLSHQPKDRLCLGASASTTGATAEVVVFSDVRFRPVAGAAVPPPARPKH